MIRILFGAFMAAVFGLSASAAASADLSPSERTSVPARADGAPAERVTAQAGDLKLDQNRGDLKLAPQNDLKARPREEIKQKTLRGQKVQKPKKPQRRFERAKQALKQVPGALVR